MTHLMQEQPSCVVVLKDFPGGKNVVDLDMVEEELFISVGSSVRTYNEKLLTVLLLKKQNLTFAGT